MYIVFDKKNTYILVKNELILVVFHARNQKEMTH